MLLVVGSFFRGSSTAFSCLLSGRVRLFMSKILASTLHSPIIEIYQLSDLSL